MSWIGVAIATVSGVMANRAAVEAGNEEKRAAEEQTRVASRENIALEKRQKLAFLKSGVGLEGTPLLMLAETEKIGKSNEAEITRGGSAAANARYASGRAAMVKSVGSAASSYGNRPTEDFGKAPTGEVSRPVARPTR